jgi:Holliday junction DNA helicase RuvA
MALNILSGINPGEFSEALAQRDIRRLAGIPGIGKKSAERIIVELKDKKIALAAPRRAAAPGEGFVQDALSALINLGYPKNVAEKALDAARGQGAGTLEELLRQSLKWLSK